MIVSGLIDQVQGCDLGMSETIYFLDFEASSLSNKSYPIEVAWSSPDGPIESYLISPSGIEEWTDWDPAAENVHGISRHVLAADGKTPHFVCDRMTDQLAGKRIYTDAPRFDGAWLARLFSACGRDKSGFNLGNIDDLLVKLICPELSGRTQGLIKIAVLKQEARRQNPRRHRAAWDVEYLVKLWELANYHAAR